MLVPGRVICDQCLRCLSMFLDVFGDWLLDAIIMTREWLKSPCCFNTLSKKIRKKGGLKWEEHHPAGLTGRELFFWSLVTLVTLPNRKVMLYSFQHAMEHRLFRDPEALWFPRAMTSHIDIFGVGTTLPNSWILLFGMQSCRRSAQISLGHCSPWIGH